MSMTNNEVLAQVAVAQSALKKISDGLPPSPPPVKPSVPTSYLAITDREVRTKPPLLTLGPAGFKFPDPKFGSRMMRITDAQTRSEMPGRSFRVPSSAHQSAWSADGKYLFVISNDGSMWMLGFDATTMTVTPAFERNVRSYVEPQFSLVDPNIMFGAGGPKGHTVLKFHLDTGVASSMVDLDTLGLNLDAGSYIGGVTTGGTTTERMLTFFGGGGQDAHRYVLLQNVGNGQRLQIDTVTRLGFHLHAVSIDMSGRYVSLYPSGGDRALNPSLEQDYVWDTVADTVTPITAAMHPSGHDAWGHGVRVNNDCCTACEWDAAQWQFRDMKNMAETFDLIVPVLRPKEVYFADHTNWRNSQPGKLVPVISGTYRLSDVDNEGNPVPWRPWDDEIVGIETANPGQPNTVWRFGHHRSDVRSDNGVGQYFWYEPIVNVSPDGRWAIFTSNWEKMLGKDTAEGTARQDVFLIELKAA